MNYGDVQSMIEDEAIKRRAAVNELRDLIDLRTQEHNEAMAELQKKLLRALDARTTERV